MNGHGFGSHGPALGNDRMRVTETRHAPALRTPAHDHDVACLHYVLDGVYSESTRQGRHDLTAGDLLFKPAGEVHWNEFAADTGSVTLRVELTPDAIPALDRKLPPRLTTSRCPHLASLARRAHDETRSRDELSPLVVEALALEILVRLARSERPPRRCDRTLATACARFLDTSFRDRISLADAARELDAERTHLARVFRRELGCTVGEYIRRRRVLHVADALRHSGAPPLAELALAAGFADQSHLTRCFNKELGETPARWRRRHARG